MFGIKVTFSAYALQDSDVRLFPLSKHRSKRIHKKLVKRFGGEFRRIPAVYHTPHGLIAHPSLRLEIEKALKQ